MKFQLSSLKSNFKSDLIILGLDHKNKIFNESDLNPALKKRINNFIRNFKISDQQGAHEIFTNEESGQKYLIVRFGDIRSLDTQKMVKILKKIVLTIKNQFIKSVEIHLAKIKSKSVTIYDLVFFYSRIVIDGLYEINSLKSKKVSPKNILNIIYVDNDDMSLAKKGLNEGEAVALGANYSKDLGNLPPNVCTPTYLGNEAKKLAKKYKMKVKVLGQKEIEKLKMGSFLSVAKGSRQEPRFIVLEHSHGKKGGKPTVLVGKGITFDAGGISLKPGANMDEMKYDMCGAATVLGVMKTLGILKSKINVVGLIPACENLPDGMALKPGDIVKSMSGQTIEILNTDAEGRLILCDALTYAERFKPEQVIDIATLTGACVIALGHHATGVLSNNDQLAEKLVQSGYNAEDKAWRLPIWDEYQSQLDSNFADMANIGGRAAGTITAACFLSRFTQKYKWAHLDIAGTAWIVGKNKGSTGRPVNLLVDFLTKVND